MVCFVKLVEIYIYVQFQNMITFYSEKLKSVLSTMFQKCIKKTITGNIMINYFTEILTALAQFMDFCS